MLVTLAAVIFFGAILAFFSQEFIRVIKKIFAIKGAKLFLPLLIASWLIFTFDYWLLWIVYYYIEMLHRIVAFLVYIMPFQYGAQSVAIVILLTVISVVPVIVLDFFARRENYKAYKYPNVTSALIFIVSAAVLLAL